MCKFKVLVETTRVWGYIQALADKTSWQTHLGQMSIANIQVVPEHGGEKWPNNLY